MFNETAYARRRPVKVRRYVGPQTYTLGDLACCCAASDKGEAPTSTASAGIPRWMLYAALAIGGLLILKR